MNKAGSPWPARLRWVFWDIFLGSAGGYCLDLLDVVYGFQARPPYLYWISMVGDTYRMFRKRIWEEPWKAGAER